MICIRNLCILFFLLMVFPGCHKNPDDTRPNIVLIMGDDIGFSDIGCYGGEIKTPNLDKLASEGLRFREFYNMAKCEPSRSALLTGMYHGNEKAVNVASLLGDAGYATIQCGKEHFQNWVPDRCYAKNTFRQSLTFWAINQFFIPPDGKLTNPYVLNGKEVNVEELENEIEPFYKTDVLTDYAIRFLEEAILKDDPFFLYMPYNSAHYPLQARPEDIAIFRNTYRSGWDNLRQKRYERMIEMGILDAKYKLSPPSSNINKYRGHPPGDDDIREKIPLYRPWDSLTEQEKDDLDLEMAVYAAMVFRLDLNIGRIVNFLKDNDKLDNTLIMYLSDNGSCPYDSNRDFIYPPGSAESYRTLCAAWANLGNTPFRYFKQFGHEGGCHTHFIVYWPEKIRNIGGITDVPGHIVDLFPTLLDAAGIQYPESYDNLPTLPLAGRSLLPAFTGDLTRDFDFMVSGFTDRFRMYRKGDYKLVRLNDEEWELYNMEEDMTELNDLAEENPEKVRDLVDEYETWKENLPE